MRRNKMYQIHVRNKITKNNYIILECITREKKGKKKRLCFVLKCFIYGFESTSGQCEYFLKERSRSTVKLFRTFLPESHRITYVQGYINISRVVHGVKFELWWTRVFLIDVIFKSIFSTSKNSIS